VRVYLNGQWVSESEARISMDDRGFLFGDGVYEVLHVYSGQAFRVADHLDRLERSMKAIYLDGPPRSELESLVAELARDARDWQDATLYIQVSRGAHPRNHVIPVPAIPPTVLAWVRPIPTPDPVAVAQGITAVTVPDDRWAKCWIKTVNLLPNILAKEKARRAGAHEAIFVRDGMAIEGTSANLFVVRGGSLETAPVTNYILPGVTRQVVLELAAELGIPVRMEPCPVEELYTADEIFLTGTTTEILPVVTVDGRPVSDGAGPVTARLMAAYQALVGRAGHVQVRP
jgi:D-alanine transaminase